MKSILLIMLVCSQGLQAVEIYGKITRPDTEREYCLVSGKTTFQIHVNSSFEFRATIPDFGRYEVWATRPVRANTNIRGQPPVYKNVYAKYSEIHITAKYDHEIDALAHAVSYKIINAPMDLHRKFGYVFHGDGFPGAGFRSGSKIDSSQAFYVDLFVHEPIQPEDWKFIYIDELRGPRAFESEVETPIPGKHVELDFRTLKPVEKPKPQRR